MHHKLGTNHCLLLVAAVTGILSHAITSTGGNVNNGHSSSHSSNPSSNSREAKIELLQPQVATPSQPITLHINITTVNITWTYPDPDTPTDPPTQFIVQIRSQSYNDSNFHNLTTPLSELYYIYEDLAYGVFYQFRIIAISDGHLSEPSENSQIFDNGLTAPPGPPLNLKIPSITANSILLTWQDPQPPNELKYLYHIYQGSTPDVDQFKLVDSVQENTQYTFHHLRAFTEYYFSVQADFGGERSIKAPPVSAMFLNPSLLPPVSNVLLSANYTTVELVWPKPIITEYNVLIQAYSVIYTPLTAPPDHAPPPPDSFLFSKIVDTPHVVLADLEQNTSYAFMIRYAFTIDNSTSSDQYYSDYSTVYRATTLSSLKCLSCHSVSSTQITLLWEVLKDNSNGGNQQLYIVTAVPTIGSRNFTSGNARGTFDIQGLHPWAKYQMYIKLKGTYGEQTDMCPLTDCRTDEAKPSGYPISLSATPISSTAINVSWANVPKNLQNGIILSYVVGCPRCPVNQYTTPGKHYIITDLTPNQEYILVVAAINDKGYGPDSPPVTVRTIGKKLETSPTDVTVEHSTPTYVMLSWKPPNSTQTSGKITQYTVTYGKPSLDSYQARRGRGQDVRGSSRELTSVSINTTSSNANLTGLTPNTTYSVSVSAWTYVGQGPYSSPILFHTPSDLSCPFCVLNISVEIASPSRKCFNIILSWLLYGTPSNLRVVYYTLTLLSLDEPAFTKTLLDSNTTNIIVSSDSLHSNHQYTIILEALVQLDSSEFSIQNNSSVKTPPCTGVKTVVAVVVTSVCIVLALVLVGMAFVIVLKCYSRKKATLRNTSRSAAQSQMSRRVVVSNDYISLMKQQRGDGHSTTNTGSLSTSTNGSYHETPSLSSTENENEPLIPLPLDEPLTFSTPTFTIPTPTVSTIPAVIHDSSPPSTHQLHSSQPPLFDSYRDNSFPFVEQENEADGYVPDDMFFIPVKPVPPDSNYIRPLRESPEGSSLSSLSSNKSSDQLL